MTVRYKTFCISDVFSVKHVQKLKLSGRAYVMDKDIISEDGKTPYIAAISRDNGITGYSDYAPNNKGDCITLSTTADSSNTVFYQKDDFIGRQQIAEIRRKDGKPLGVQCGLYVATIIRGLTRQFNYANKLTIDYLQQAAISLPITADGTPDWQYMQERISKLEKESITELEKYLTVSGLDDYTLTHEDREMLAGLDASNESVEFQSTTAHYKTVEVFHISDVFDIKNSHNILKSDVILGSGEHPYVTAGEGDNSILGYIDYDEKLMEDGDCIFIGGKTMVFSYQEEPFFSNDSHNLLLYCKDPAGRGSLPSLYMITQLKKALCRYSWNDSISFKKIQGEVFTLPIQTDAAEQPIIDENRTYHPDGLVPDWKYMAAYIRAIEKLVIQNMKSFNIQVF